MLGMLPISFISPFSTTSSSPSILYPSFNGISLSLQVAVAVTKESLSDVDCGTLILTYMFSFEIIKLLLAFLRVLLHLLIHRFPDCHIHYEKCAKAKHILISCMA